MRKSNHALQPGATAEIRTSRVSNCYTKKLPEESLNVTNLGNGDKKIATQGLQQAHVHKCENT